MTATISAIHYTVLRTAWNRYRLLGQCHESLDVTLNTLVNAINMAVTWYALTAKTYQAPD